MTKVHDDIAARIAVIGLGGTISMVAGPQGLIPARSVQTMIGEIAHAYDRTEFVCHDICTVPSASIELETLDRVARLIDGCVADGITGVVVIQGTDSMEETAFALELLCAPDLPVVMTGAMRGAQQAGADGPANLKAAIIVASSAPHGVYVVMNDEVHAARYVSKRHTTALNAFSSGDTGPVGRVHEGRLTGFRSPGPRLKRLQTDQPAPWPRVAVLTSVLGDDAGMIRSVVAGGYQGCVLDAMGAGHVPAALVADIEIMVAAIPVLLCSRTDSGRVCENTYAYPGSEVDLLARGVSPACTLTTIKTRILLLCALRANENEAPRSVRDTIRII